MRKRRRDNSERYLMISRAYSMALCETSLTGMQRHIAEHLLYWRLSGDPSSVIVAPTVSALAESTGYSPARVRLGLKAIASAGIIEIISRPGRASEYVFAEAWADLAVVSRKASKPLVSYKRKAL